MIDQKTPFDAYAAIEQLYFAYRAFTDRADNILAERGLGRVHHRILYFVGRKPGIAVNALLETLQVSKQALNGPLRQLVAEGLVEIAVGQHDRRVRELSLTAHGRALETILTSTQIAHVTAAFEAVGESDAAGWRRMMAAIASPPA